MISVYLCMSVLIQIVKPQHYTHQWAVHVPGGQDTADAVAAEHGFVNLGQIFDDYWHFQHPQVRKRSIQPHDQINRRLEDDNRVHWSKQQKAKSRKKRYDFFKRPMPVSDPEWPYMWYLNRGYDLDMNVIPAWEEGITGKGIVVTILDDGLETTHPDLLQNYDPLASYDINSQDPDPSPRYDILDTNRHGTRCAGEVAATSNNSLCAIGIAHGAHIGGVRMLDGDVTDVVEARALSFNPQHIDIYSASWGPDDDGRSVDGPGELAKRAFYEGVTKGRGGKGSIFIWASGNGGKDHDNCNCDGYTNSVYSLSISSATEHGRAPWYSEACSSTLAATYSSGEMGEKQIITTDLHHSCTMNHTGTSASAPLAAGICALALQANKNLTWRDMQHIVVRTARPHILHSTDWVTNAVGRDVSHHFGYGLMDAHEMVKLARIWKTVPPQKICELTAPHFDKIIYAKSDIVLLFPVKECKGVEVLEHVQAKLSISTQRRGDIHITLTSPMGTKATLLDYRFHDNSKAGFNSWPFMSVHSWGESPIGVWQLEIKNMGRLLGRATLQNWSLILYGTRKFQPIDSANDIPSPTIKTPKIKNKKKCKKQKNKSTEKMTTTPVHTQTQKTKNIKYKNSETTTTQKYTIPLVPNSRKKKPLKPKNNQQKTTTTPVFILESNKKVVNNVTPESFDIVLEKYDYDIKTETKQKTITTPIFTTDSNKKFVNNVSREYFDIVLKKYDYKTDDSKKKQSNKQKTTSTPISTVDPNKKIVNNVTPEYFDIVLEKYDNISEIPQDFQKYSKFQHVYPAVYSQTNKDYKNDEIKVEQTLTNKQKELGRNININRNAKNTKFIKNTPDLVTSPVNITTAQSPIIRICEYCRSNRVSNEGSSYSLITEAKLILHGTKKLADLTDVKQPKTKPTFVKKLEEDKFADASCAKRNKFGICLECREQYYLEKFTEISSSDSPIEMNQTCLPCHYSCKKCVGGADYQCLECFEDAAIWYYTHKETYCLFKDITRDMQQTLLYYRIYCISFYFLIANIIIILILVFRRYYNSTRKTLS